MSALQWLEIAAAVVFGCTLQGAVGFGGGLFAIPLMVWSGLSLPSAIAVILGGVFVQTSWNLYRYRGHVSLNELMPITLIRIVSMPVGVMLLSMLVGLGTDRVKQVIGIVLILVLAMQRLFRISPRERVSADWTVLAGVTSGLMAGTVGMGGPPVVLWVMAHDWPGRKSRSFLWATFLMLTPFNLGVLVYRFGGEIWVSLGVGLCLAPLIIIGSELGQRLGGMMNRHRLRSTTMLMLLLLAVMSVVGPLF
ncbi:MAG: sulfite exporter TauE/SafE family protein [Phycisphaeraceae bacterium]